LAAGCVLLIFTLLFSKPQLFRVLTQEIYLKRNKIIKEINRRLGGEAVETIKFRM
jgi:membrane protein CcdC involved in cytochrome C biogenesis